MYNLKSKVYVGMGKPLTQEQVLERFRKVHGNRYNYSEVVYKGDSTKVTIICEVHGRFNQTPGCHYRQKQGCPKCNGTGGLNKLSKKTVIERIEEVWGKGYFDYTKTFYKDAHTKIELHCNIHNITFKTYVRSLTQLGIGCRECNAIRFYKKHNTKHQENFIRRSKEIHGEDTYDYSKVKYVNSNTPVTLVCRKHGKFQQLPVVHKNARSGCPTCSSSKGERRIYNHLHNCGLSFKPQHQIRHGNSFHYFDAYVPSLDLFIEFNGKQHYEPITWTASMKIRDAEERFLYQKERDKLKREYCEQNCSSFIEISYKEFDKIESILDKEFNRIRQTRSNNSKKGNKSN